MGRITICKKYRPLWESDCTTFIVTGGRGSGKSFAVGDFIENLSFQKGHKILFTRYTLDSASLSIIPEFEEKIHLEAHKDKFYITKTEVINSVSGTVIYFRGIRTSSGNQTAKLKSIEGLTTWVLEEAEELTDQATFDVIKQSIRKAGIKNRVILVLNPKVITHWIYQEFFESRGVKGGFNGEKDDVCYIHTTYQDNLVNLSDEFIKDAKRAEHYTPILYRYNYLGEWVTSLENSVFNIENLNRYNELNEEGVSLCFVDTADAGEDHFAAVFARMIKPYVYITDAIFNLHNLNDNEEILIERLTKHKVDRCYIETNSAGAYFARNIRQRWTDGVVYGQHNFTNKIGRILAQSGYILENFYFPAQHNDEMSKFIIELCSFLKTGSKHDDAPDCLSGLAFRVRRDFN